MKSLVVPLVLACLGTGAAFAGLGPQEPPITSQPVAGDVHVLFGRGGNVAASIGADGVLLVDDKFADLEQPIRAELKKLGGEDVVFLVNTHWHGDHTGGNAGFGAGSTVIAQTNVRRRLAGDSSVGGRVQDPPSPKPALPVVTYDDGLSIHFNGEEVRLMHFGPGHTDGDSIVWFTGANVVHMGDLYFDSGYPLIDLSSGGSVQGMIADVKAALERIPADAKVISGHGRVTGVPELREYLRMLETIVERVKEGVGLDQTPEQMVSDGLTEDFDERWGKGFIKPADFVTTIVESLKKDG